MKSRTKEEKLLLSIYEAALNSGDLFNPVDPIAIGESRGLHPRGVKTICRELMQANFIKKAGPSEVIITENGLSLVRRLHGE